jgi:hypothetical protein
MPPFGCNPTQTVKLHALMNMNVAPDAPARTLQEVNNTRITKLEQATVLMIDVDNLQSSY